MKKETYEQRVRRVLPECQWEIARVELQPRRKGTPTGSRVIIYAKYRDDFYRAHRQCGCFWFYPYAKTGRVLAFRTWSIKGENVSTSSDYKFRIMNKVITEMFKL